MNLALMGRSPNNIFIIINNNKASESVLYPIAVHGLILNVSANATPRSTISITPLTSMRITNYSSRVDSTNISLVLDTIIISVFVFLSLGKIIPVYGTIFEQSVPGSVRLKL